MENEKRKNFIDALNVNNETNNDLIPDFMKERSKKISETYKADKGQMNSIRKNVERYKPKTKKAIKRALKTGAALLIAGGMITGPIVKYNSYSDINKNGETLTVERLSNDKELMKEMNVSEENMLKYLELKELYQNPEATNIDRMNATEKIFDLGMDTLKQNIAYATGKDKKDITIGGPNIRKQDARISEGGILEYDYEKGDILNVWIEGIASYFGLDSKAMSDNIAYYIVTMEELQEQMEQNKNGEDIDMSKVNEINEKGLKTIGEMMTKEFIVDGKVLKTEDVENKKAKIESANTNVEKEIDDTER